ncbi:DUF4262 domain-containing protein [Thermocrispum agreste]|uniref:DUF4262 domain-containing protein n=2 Tax=Thermocrispum agreste TaxID=37925 RepID=A0A2W4LQ84_9PSEU|nr:MAG: DUF4262 domain-containing protein [Thermocrispum agreste]
MSAVTTDSYADASRTPRPAPRRAPASPVDAVLSPEEAELKEWMLEQAQTRGNAVISVQPGDGVGNFEFTAGAWRTHGVAEAVVIGLPRPMGTVLLDAYVDRAATGEQFRIGVPYEDFFDGVPVLFQKVAERYYPQYFGSAFLLYPMGDFPALQIVVPTPQGQWPWSPDAPPGFRRWQPVLTDTGQPDLA